MPNRIVSTCSIERHNGTGAIKRVTWFAQNLCGSVEPCKPENAVYLLEAFGPGTPQVLSFVIDDDEFGLYMSADADLAKEIYEFLKAEGKVKIKSTHRSRKNITHWETVDWEIPVTAHADYMEGWQTNVKNSPETPPTH